MTTDTPICGSVRYAPNKPCSEEPPGYRVVYRTSTGALVASSTACFTHGLAEVDRHHASAGIARCDLEENPMTIHATDQFNLVWQNDQDVYHAVLDHARYLLRRVPGMTDQTLGRNIKDRVFAWAYGGGWGYSTGWGGATSSLRDCDRYPDWATGGPPPGYRVSPFSYFPDADTHGYVNEETVAEDVREALRLEGYGPDTGNRLDPDNEPLAQCEYGRPLGHD